VEFFGILHCVQDDSRNLQRQVRSWGQRKLATASAQLGTAETCNGKCAVGDNRNLQWQMQMHGKCAVGAAGWTE
jgi:hypothetical protein